MTLLTRKATVHDPFAIRDELHAEGSILIRIEQMH